MKKFYAVLVLWLLAMSTNAQNYHPMIDSVSNIWYFTGNLMPVRTEATAASLCDYNTGFGFESNTLFTTGDTVMNGFTYKILNQSAFNWPGFDCVYGYLREDTTSKKVYFVDNLLSPEMLLYDFSMVPGNTIYLEFNQQFGFYATGTYQLDSIVPVQINAGVRNFYYLSNPSVPFQQPLQWIESVGHPGHLIYPYSQNMWGMLFSNFCSDRVFRDFYQMLTCFEHGPQKIYFDSCSRASISMNPCFYYLDSCNYWNICGSLNETSSILTAKSSPNPFQDNTSLTIESVAVLQTEIKIYNLTGQLMQEKISATVNPGKNNIPLHLSSLNAGCYLVNVRSEKNNFFVKIVKTSSAK